MNTATLIEDLKRRGVRLEVQGDQLVVDAPRGILTNEITAALAAHKRELLRSLPSDPQSRVVAEPRRALADIAADLLPNVHFTIRETGNTRRDFNLRARQVIEEFQPGGNHIYLRIITLDGRRVVVEWRAVAARELRIGLGQILAKAAVSSEPTR